MVPEMLGTNRCGREGVWPYLDPWDGVRPRTASTHWDVPKECVGRMASSSSSF